MLELLIQMGPTILFLLNLALAIIFGLLRGFHKNLILAIQALIALAICTITFFVLVNDANFDTNIYQMINGIMGGSLNSTIGVSEGCSSLKEVLTEMIVNMSSEGGIGNTIQLIVSNNGEYLGALVNSAYRLVLALILSIVYLLLVFILYLVYFIFYPERRRKEKKSERFSLAESNKPYKKRRLLGAVVGSVRGIVSSIVLLSFLGTFLYIISGSNTKSEDVDFGDDSINEYYGIYQNISSYNEYGIYSILSSIKDPNQIPYYLYISDAVFSGNATEIKENGDSTTASFVLKDELGSYTKFSKNAIYLVNKYNPDLIKKAVAGAETEELMTELASTFASAEFQAEFSELINGFNDNSFILNFALVALDAVASNYDSFISIEDKATSDLLDIVFKGEHKIKVSQILTKDDAVSLLNATVKILSNPVIFDSTLTASFDGEAAEKLISSTEVLSDALASLSLFNDRSEGFNLLFADIFDYLTEEATILDTQTAATSYICNMTNTSVNEVNWASELKGIISVLPNVITLYSDIDLSNTEDTTALVESAFNLLATTNTNHDRNETALDNIINVFGNSKVISVLMNLDPVYNALFGSLGEDVTIVIPEVNYENTVDQNGNVVDGEITNLLKGIKALLSSGGEAVIELLNFTSEESDLQLGTIMETALTALLSKDNNNLSLIDYLSKSTIVRSILSSYIDTLEFPIGESNLSIYLPESSYKVVGDKEGNTVRLINEAELPNIISNILPVVTAYKDILNKYNEEDGFDLSAILASDKIDTLCSLLKNSQILEGTISNILISSLSSIEYVTLPKEYMTPDGWLSSIVDGELQEGELIKTVRIFQNVDMDFNRLLDGDISYILSDGLTDDNIDALLSSDILTISISGLLRNFSYSDEAGNELISIIVPTSSLEATTYTDSNDEIINCIKASELKNILSIVLGLVSFDDDNNVKVHYSNIFSKDDDGSYLVLGSDVLCATVVYALKNNIEKITYAEDSAYAGQAIITMPASLSNAALKDTLINNTAYNGVFSSNPWNNELDKLLDAVDILLDISSNPDFDFTGDLTDTLLTSILSLNTPIAEGNDETKLDVVYASTVIKDTLSSALPKLTDQIIVPVDAKDTDGYINISELEVLFDIVNVILGDNKSFENIDFSNLVISSSMKTSFSSSNIISASITNYIINDEQLDNLISIPESTVINNHITKEEMGRLYDSLLALVGDTDGNISLASLSNLDANKMLHLPNEKIDTILSSVILQYSISKIIESTDYGDLEIIIPSEAYAETSTDIHDIHGEVIRTITKDTLNSLVSAIGLIINDGTEISVNVKNIFVNKNALIANPILHATVIYFLIKTFSAEDSVVSIPQTLKDSGSSNALKQGITGNLWNTTNELINLLNAFDLLLGVSDSTDDSFDFNDTAGLTNSIFTSVLSLNDPYEGKTKLDYVYSSQIIKATLKTNIDGISQIVVPQDALENDYIKASELANVITFVKSILTTGQSFNDFDASMIKINNDTKNLLINSNILLATVTKYIKESNIDLLIIPSSAIDPTYGHLTNTEAGTLFDNIMMLFGTDISFTSISFNFNKLASLSDEQVDSLVSSLCLRYTLSNYLISNETLMVVIPLNQLDSAILDINNNSVQAIKEEELSSALSTILDFITLDNSETPDVDETGINIQKVFSSKNDIIASDILHATIIKYLVDEFTKDGSVVTIPSSLALAGSKEELEKGMAANEWTTTNELVNLLNALDLLLGVSDNENFELSNTDAITKALYTSLLGLNEAYEGKTKLDYVYSSQIIKATLKTNIDSISQIVVPQDALENDYIKASELANVISFVNTLVNVDEGETFEDLDTTKIMINNDTKAFIINSNILLATVTNYLKDSNIELLIIPETVIDQTYNHLTSTEAEKLFNNIMMLLGDNISFNNISFNFNKLASLSDEEIAAFVSSQCLRYSISNFLISNEAIQVVIPSNQFDDAVLDIHSNNVKAIKETEISNALSAILDFITLDNPETTDVDETGIDIQKVFLSKNKIISSDILHATIIKFLVDEFTKEGSVVVIPTHLVASGSKDELEKGMAANEWTSSSELLYLINALDLLLGISSTPNFNLGSINIDNALKDMNIVVSGQTETKLELCYRSEIMKATFTTTISKYVDDIPGASYDANDYINASELATFFDILNIVAGENGITGLTDDNIKNINVSAVIAVIINNGSSFIVRSLLSGSILDALSVIYPNLELLLDCYDSSANTSISGNKNTTLNILSLAEIQALEAGLKAILNVHTDIIASNINTGNVILDEAKIETAYQSRIIQVIISKALKSSLGEANILKECYNNNSLIAGQVFNSTNIAYNLYLNVSDVKALIHGICTVTGVTSISANSISLSGVEVSNTTMAALLDSKIAHVLISNQIKTTLDVPTTVYDTNIKASDNLDVVSKTELTALINSILLVLGTEKININSFNFANGSISSLAIDDILASKIAHNQITKAMLVCCTTIPTAAYDDLEKQFIKASEIEALVQILGTKENNGTTDYYKLSLNGAYSFGSFDNTKIEAMADSYIIRNKVSKELLDQSSSIYIPTSVVELINDDKYISKAEFKAFLSALAQYGSSLTSISISLPGSEEVELFAASVIMRATITNSINIDGYSIYFAQGDVILDKSYSTNADIVVLTNQGFKELINATRILVTGNELTISLSIDSILGLDSTMLDTLLASNTLRYAISDLLINYINSLAPYFKSLLLTEMTKQGITIGTEAVYIIQGILSQKDVYSKNGIIGIVNILNKTAI